MRVWDIDAIITPIFTLPLRCTPVRTTHKTNSAPVDISRLNGADGARTVLHPGSHKEEA